MTCLLFLLHFYDLKLLNCYTNAIYSGAYINIFFTSPSPSPPSPSPRVFVATASPAKFPEAVTKALSGGAGKDSEAYLKAMKVAADVSKPFDRLKALPRRDLKMEKNQDWEKMLREKIEELKRG